MYLGIFGNQFPGHQGNIVGRSHMAVHVQTAAVDKVSVLHAKLFRPIVHHFHKKLFRSGDVLRHCYGGIIRRGYGNALDHRIHTLSLPLL